jgi:hypothetical protein
MEPQINDPPDIGIMDMEKAEFYVTAGGFTGLKYGGADYKHITLRRILPIGKPMEYISVADHENKEIGIIRSVEALKGDQLKIVVNELDNRYYSPLIAGIISVSDKLGYVYIEMKLKNKSGSISTKSCAVKDVNRNIRMLGDNSLIIFDVDGNRYIIEDIMAMDKNSVKKLDPYLF